MRFTKPINREIEISGNTFVVTLDEGGASFRLKGKRRSTHINWTSILQSSAGEDGVPALEYLGLQREEAASEKIAEPASEPVVSASATAAGES